MQSPCMITAAICPSGIAPHRRTEALADTVSRGLTRVTLAWHAWQRHRQAMAALNAMPLDLRKDLGWPASDTRADMKQPSLITSPPVPGVANRLEPKSTIQPPHA